MILVFATVDLATAASMAAGCTTHVGDGRYGESTINIGVSCESSNPGSPTTDPSPDSRDPAPECVRPDGMPTACWYGDYWWSPAFNLYCQVATIPQDSPIWNTHRDSAGNPTGTAYQCLVSVNGTLKNTLYWQTIQQSTPIRPGTDPVTLVRSALASLDLHPPTVGVGAYIYPHYENWGLSWWVGAPMWLWVDATDDLQWGTHTLTATQDGTTVTATVTPTTATFDPGDGTTPITCPTPGTPRPWNPDDLLSHHSPTGCEHTYTTTNQLGSIDSRYTITATVTWTIDWTTTDHQHGTFTTTTTSTDHTTIHVGELRIVRPAS